VSTGRRSGQLPGAGILGSAPRTPAPRAPTMPPLSLPGTRWWGLCPTVPQPCCLGDPAPTPVHPLSPACTAAVSTPGAARAPPQEDPFVRGHGAVTGHCWPVPSPPPPAIKCMRGCLQLPPSLGSAGLAPQALAWPLVLPEQPWHRPRLAGRGVVPPGLGPGGSAPTGSVPRGQWSSAGTDAGVGRAAGRASVEAGAAPPVSGRFSSQPGHVGSWRAEPGLGARPEAGVTPGLPCHVAEGTGHPVPARGDGREGPALPAAARAGRKDETQTCSSKDPSLY